MTITRTCRGEAPEGSIINGQIINEDDFDAFLLDFWVKNALPKKDVVLVLGGTASANRRMQVPKLNHDQLMDYLPREYAATEQRKDPVFAYMVQGQQGKLKELYTTMMERSFLEPHLTRFKKLGITLSGVVAADIGRVVALDNLSYLAGKTFVVQALDGMSLNNILYVNGQYYQHNTRRIFGERGTPAFGVECARNVSSLQQFLKTQQIDSAVSAVYLCGEFGAEGLEVCRESILQMDDSLEVDRLYEEPGGAISYRAEETEEFDYYTSLIGALMVPTGAGSLLRQYYHSPEQVKKQKARIRRILPMAVTGVVLAVVAAAGGVLWYRLADQVSQQLDYMGNAAVIEHVAEYDRLQTENEALGKRADVVEKTRKNLASYPVYTSQIKQTVQECAAGLATVELTSFDQQTGVLSINASSTSAEDVHQFVNRLEERSDLFQNVYYDGFQMDERSQLWNTAIQCYLVGPEAEETGTGAGEVTS